MEQKKYTFTGPGGEQITKTLAPPQNKTLVNALAAFGVSSFKELFAAQNMVDVMIVRLDFAVDTERLKKILDVVLVEGHDGMDLETIDMREIDGVIQDFFDQRSKSLLERRNN
jgi:hypothetical protein